MILINQKQEPNYEMPEKVILIKQHYMLNVTNLQPKQLNSLACITLLTQCLYVSKKNIHFDVLAHSSVSKGAEVVVMRKLLAVSNLL